MPPCFRIAPALSGIPTYPRLLTRARRHSILAHAFPCALSGPFDGLRPAGFSISRLPVSARSVLISASTVSMPFIIADKGTLVNRAEHEAEHPASPWEWAQSAKRRAQRGGAPPKIKWAAKGLEGRGIADRVSWERGLWSEVKGGKEIGRALLYFASPCMAGLSSIHADPSPGRRLH